MPYQKYKVLVIASGEKKGCCCVTRIPLPDEVERACNEMAKQGWTLVTVHEQYVNRSVSCYPQAERGYMLVFGKE